MVALSRAGGTAALESLALGSTLANEPDPKPAPARPPPLDRADDGWTQSCESTGVPEWPSHRSHKGFYNAAAWRKLRAAQLAREPLCKFCLAEGRVTGRPSLIRGAPTGAALSCSGTELQCLCATCLSLRKHSQEKGGTKHLAGCGPDSERLFHEW
jgi:hypothetical protein